MAQHAHNALAIKCKFIARIHRLYIQKRQEKCMISRSANLQTDLHNPVCMIFCCWRTIWKFWDILGFRLENFIYNICFLERIWENYKRVYIKLLKLINKKTISWRLELVTLLRNIHFSFNVSPRKWTNKRVRRGSGEGKGVGRNSSFAARSLVK